MTERERLQLFEAAGFDKIISQDFKTYLLANGFFRSPASTKYHGCLLYTSPSPRDCS